MTFSRKESTLTDTAEPQTQPSQQNAQAQQPQQSSQQSKHMMTPREKKWIVYDVGNSAFVLLSTAVVPIYANSLLKACLLYTSWSLK